MKKPHPSYLSPLFPLNLGGRKTHFAQPKLCYLYYSSFPPPGLSVLLFLIYLRFYLRNIHCSHNPSFSPKKTQSFCPTPLQTFYLHPLQTIPGYSLYKLTPYLLNPPPKCPSALCNSLNIPRCDFVNAYY